MCDIIVSTTTYTFSLSNFAFFRAGIITFSKEPELKQRTEVDSIKSDNIADYLGKDVGFYKILDHFTKLYETKYNRGIKNLLQGEFPQLIDGPLIGIYHGIIQLGYGYAGGCDQVYLIVNISNKENMNFGMGFKLKS